MILNFKFYFWNRLSHVSSTFGACHDVAIFLMSFNRSTQHYPDKYGSDVFCLTLSCNAQINSSFGLKSVNINEVLFNELLSCLCHRQFLDYENYPKTILNLSLSKATEILNNLIKSMAVPM